MPDIIKGSMVIEVSRKVAAEILGLSATVLTEKLRLYNDAKIQVGNSGNKTKRFKIDLEKLYEHLKLEDSRKWGQVDIYERMREKALLIEKKTPTRGTVAANNPAGEKKQQPPYPIPVEMKKEQTTGTGKDRHQTDRLASPEESYHTTSDAQPVRTFGQEKWNLACPISCPLLAGRENHATLLPSWSRIEAKINDIRGIAYSMVRRDYSFMTVKLKMELERKISRQFRHSYRRLIFGLAGAVLVAITAFGIVSFLLSAARAQKASQLGQVASMNNASINNDMNFAKSPLPNAGYIQSLEKKVTDLQSQLSYLTRQLEMSRSANRRLLSENNELKQLNNAALMRIDGLEAFTNEQNETISRLKRKIIRTTTPELLSDSLLPRK